MVFSLLQKVRVKAVEASVCTTDFSECTIGVQEAVRNRVDKGGVEEASKKECLEDMANVIVFATRLAYFHLRSNERCTISGLSKGI